MSADSIKFNSEDVLRSLTIIQAEVDAMLTETGNVVSTIMVVQASSNLAFLQRSMDIVGSIKLTVGKMVESLEQGEIAIAEFNADMEDVSSADNMPMS